MTSHNEDDIIRNIEEQLANFETKLRGKSKAEQERLINEERGNMVSLVRTLLGMRKLGFVGSMVSWVTLKVTQFFGFDPFEWLHFAEYADHNADIAERAFSNPSLFDALQQAGELLEGRNSSHLKKLTKRFQEEISSTGDANTLAEAIITFCSCIPAIYRGTEITLNPNDVKILLANVLRNLLDTSCTKEHISAHISNPVIRPGFVCWVKYDFVSSYSFEESCCSTKKFCDLNVEMKYFVFPSEADFRAALRREEAK